MKPVIITGATSSIGHAIARQMAAEGHPLVLCARNKDKLTPIVTDIEARYGVKCVGSLFDANEIEGHDDLIKKIKKNHSEVEGIVLAHGYIEGEDGLNTTVDELHKLVKVNFESIMSILSSYAKHYKSKSFACVITSIAGDRGKARNLVYNSVKAGASVYLAGFEQAAPHISLIEVILGFDLVLKSKSETLKNKFLLWLWILIGIIVVLAIAAGAGYKIKKR